MSSAGSFIIRPLDGWAELEACVALQEATWGEGFRERVPPSLLLVAQRTGGIAAGAFERDSLVGFVFGVSGFLDRQPMHWSDMLAVRADLRDHGIGFALKRYQRDRMLEAGIDRILWTMDPLESRNAHFNFDKLGAFARHYERDLYGTSDSTLHHGLGTDRFVVTWPISTERVQRHLAGQRDWTPDHVARLPALNEIDANRSGPAPRAAAATPRTGAARLAVPADIQSLKRRDADLARAWRAHLRDALERALAAGYVATSLVRIGDVGWYVLTRE